MDTRERRTEGPFVIPVIKVIETTWIDNLMLLITSETQYKSAALRNFNPRYKIILLVYISLIYHPSCNVLSDVTITTIIHLLNQRGLGINIKYMFTISFSCTL